MDIDQSVKRFRKYVRVVEKSTDDTMKKNKARIAKMNVQQMEQGLKADGTYQEPYSEGSVEYYGKEAGPIKLKDTGAFHRGVTLKREEKNKYELTSKDSGTIEETGENKVEYLDRNYDPFGLAEYNMETVTNLNYENLYTDLKQLFA